MVALNVDIWSQAGVWHWASTSSKGTHSTATDTMLVWASCEEVVVMAILSSTRPARGGSVTTPQRALVSRGDASTACGSGEAAIDAAVVDRRRLEGRGRSPFGKKMDEAFIVDLMPPPSWKAEGHVASW